MSLTTQPDRFRAGLREAANLLEGRVRAAGDAYNRSMGPGYQRPADSWVSPESRETFQRALMIDPTKPIPPSSQEQARQQQRGGGPQPGSAQPQRGTPPVQVGTPEDARKLSPGTRFIIPSGPSKGMIGTAP